MSEQKREVLLKPVTRIQIGNGFFNPKKKEPNQNWRRLSFQHNQTFKIQVVLVRSRQAERPKTNKVVSHQFSLKC